MKDSGRAVPARSSPTLPCADLFVSACPYVAFRIFEKPQYDISRKPVLRPIDGSGNRGGQSLGPGFREANQTLAGGNPPLAVAILKGALSCAPAELHDAFSNVDSYGGEFPST